MREILFRGKLKATGEWVYGNLVVNKQGTHIITPDETPLGKYGVVIPETVGQYTGLTDNNDSKVFEGDILRDKGWDCHGYIAWSQQYLSWLFFDSNGGDEFLLELSSVPHSLDKSAVIIGNIHDNPELMEANP